MSVKGSAKLAPLAASASPSPPDADGRYVLRGAVLFWPAGRCPAIAFLACWALSGDCLVEDGGVGDQRALSQAFRGSAWATVGAGHRWSDRCGCGGS